MAIHAEDCSHGNSSIPSDSLQVAQNSKPADGIRYTKEELLSLQPVRNDDLTKKKNLSVTFDKQPSVTVENENPEDVKLDQSQGKVEDDFQREKEEGESNNLNEAMPEDKKKKKKKKSSGKNKNKQEPPSGFEEYFADVPITPEEYDEEKNDIYHHSRSFVERIQQCIQRYRARRSLNSERANIFSKYLVLGGVDAGAKAFSGGLDKETLENSTAAEIADIQATDHVRSHGPVKFYNAGDPRNWVVDFEAVAKGFLSERAPVIFGTHERDIKLYCGVISNFLNYVLRHDVCNEYQMNVMAALRLCTQAEKQLQLVSELSKLLPGEFNIAASTLYGGAYHKRFTDYTDWDVKQPLFGADDPASQNSKVVGMRVAEADRIFKTGIAFSGTYKHFRQIMAMQCHVVKVETRFMEVCEIIIPTDEMRRKLIGAKDQFGHAGSAIGVLKVKHYDSPDAQEEDVSDDGEEDSSSTDRATNTAIDDLWLEENILEKCFIGMKIQATVRELNIGIKYMDEITRVECSFYTYLETERLDRWKEPVLNNRPGPTVDDLEKNFADDTDVDFN